MVMPRDVVRELTRSSDVRTGMSGVPNRTSYELGLPAELGAYGSPRSLSL
jgi:hypothetical protein